MFWQFESGIVSQLEAILDKEVRPLIIDDLNN